MVNVIDKERQALDPALKSLLKTTSSDDNRFLYCTQCSHLLARAADATEIAGSHHHFCTNPHGIDFDVYCYSEALGSTISGPPTGADSWFAGHTWRFATCTGCTTHLGWLFETAAGHDSPTHFYGLIADRFQIDGDKSAG